MSDQLLVGFPARLEAKPVRISGFLIKVTTDAAWLDAGGS